MGGSILGFLWTLSIWAALIAAYAGIELARGHIPFAMLRWDVGGRFIAVVFLIVMALGTGIGFASDRIRARQNR